MHAPPKPDHLDVAYEKDLTIVRLRGDYDLATENYLTYVRNEAGKRNGYRLTLMDITNAGTVARDARASLVRYRDDVETPGSLALVGASFPVRTLVSMMLQAARALTRRPLDFRFFATEQEARAWLDEERVRIHSAKQRS